MWRYGSRSDAFMVVWLAWEGLLLASGKESLAYLNPTGSSFAVSKLLSAVDRCKQSLKRVVFHKGTNSLLCF